MLRAILLLVTVLFAPFASPSGLSLEEIRGRLLNQEVVVLGNSISSGSQQGLVDWYLVSGDEASGYKEKKEPFRVRLFAPETVRGKRGVVLSVEQADSSLSRKNVGEKDAFGKVISDSQVRNPYINVVVRVLDDDLLISTTSYYIVMVGMSLRIASRADSLKKEVENILTNSIGKKLYKAGYTKLYDSALSLKDLLDQKKRELSRDYETKSLTPLKVVDAKFLEAENAVVIKVELPDGQTRLLFGDLRSYDNEHGNRAKPSLQRMRISAEEKIPSKFSPKELTAIKEGKIFRGMSEDALHWSWGYAEKVNDWGRGGKQHIFHERQFVYVDGQGVRDWQSIK